MNCKKCGAEIEEDAIYCPKCGSYVELRKKESTDLAGGEESVKSAEQESTYTASEQESTYTESLGQERARMYTEEPVRQNGYTSGGETESMAGAAGSENSQYQYFDWKAASQPSAGQTPEKPKKSKAPFIVMGVIAVAIAIALIYLVVSMTNAGKAKDQVEAAIKNTFQELGKENEYSSVIDEITDNGFYTQELTAALTELSISQYGISSNLLQDLSPAEFSMRASVDRPNSCSKMEIQGGAGDMKPVQIEVLLPLEDEEGELLFGLPGLYEKYIKMSLDDLGALSGREFDVEAGAYTHIDGRDEAAEALMNTLTNWLQDAYEDVECKKTQNVKVDTGNGIVNADEYELILSNKNYEKHMKRLPEMIANDKVFMDWLTDMTSKSGADEFIDVLEEAVEESLFGYKVSKVVLCYVAIYQDKAIQIRIPFDSEEDNMAGDLSISFFGKENVGDDLRIDMDITNKRDTAKANYRAVKDGNRNNITLSMDIAGELELEMAIDGEYMVSGGSYVYDLHNFSLLMSTSNYLGESFGMNLGLSGSYTISEGADFVIPDEETAVSLMDMKDEEVQELVVTVIENASRGGYVPSAYADQFAAFVLGVRARLDSQKGVGDNGGGSLDGSEDLTYEEFAARVKEIYGDVYSDEILRQLYDDMYGSGLYGNSENPYLSCYGDDLTLELQCVEGFELDEDYSNGYELFFIREVGDDDEILLDYFITDETMDAYMEYQSEYQREYYKEAGYTTVNIGDVKHGIIGGQMAAWIEYSASDAYGNKATGIIAYAQIDEVHGCVLDMYSLFGTDEVSKELLMKCFDLYVIEN